MTNGGAVEIFVEFAFMLRPVEAFLGFFSRILYFIPRDEIEISLGAADGANR